jgi:integral membrane protein (TIGR01906 family)
VASPTARTSIGGRLGAVLVSVAAALVILGASLLPFLTPVWIHGEQDRAGAASLFGADPETVHLYTDAIVHDLVFGGAFDVGSARLMPVLDPKEEAHMRDVRVVFDELALLVLASAVVLVIAARRSRTSAVARQGLWRAVGRGARWLAVLMAAIGVVSIVAFDAAFEVFHELLFAAGSFSFDPATEHLVQLFPDQFWSDTALALGVVALVLSIGVAWIASRRAVGPTAESVAAPDAPGAASLTPRRVP